MKKILIIDDETELVEMLRLRLESNGYKVISAFNGEEGLERVDKEKPDLILLDIMMPGIDGFGALARLKNNDATSSIPVIMLTARSETSSILEAQRSFADDYIVKPFDPQELLSLIKKHIRISY
jgi:DNA-binding response OmpR family regulator